MSAIGERSAGSLAATPLVPEHSGVLADTPKHAGKQISRNRDPGSGRVTSERARGLGCPWRADSGSGG